MTKVYDTATDLITFARLQAQNTTSGSSYLGSDGLLKFAAEDEPRIEYGSDGSLKGLLIEEQRTNLVTHSDLSSGWGETRADIDPNVTTVTAPDGTSNVTAITSDLTPANSHKASKIVANPLTSTGTFTYSAFVRANGTNVQFDVIVDPAGTVQLRRLYVLFDLQAGTAATPYTAGSPNVIDYDIQDAGGGWYRCHVTTDNPDGTRVDVAMTLSQFTFSNVNPGFDGDGTSGVYVYGAQFEEGSFPTSYIPTSGSQSTRSPDIASIPVSAFGYNQDAGTVVVEFNMIADAAGSSSLTQAAFGFHDGTSSNRLELWSSSAGTLTLRDRTASANYDAQSVGNSLEQPTKSAASYASGEASKLVVNGGTALVASTATTQPAYSTLLLGDTQNINAELNGHIKSMKYYPRRLTNTQLQELTS